MKQISRIITLPLTLIVFAVAVIFALSNMGEVAVGFWPLDGTVSIYLFIVVFAMFLVGFVCGGMVVWFTDGKVRRRARKAEFEAVGLKRELGSLKQEIAKQAAAKAHRSGTGSGTAQAGTHLPPAQLGHAGAGQTPTRLTGS